MPAVSHTYILCLIFFKAIWLFVKFKSADLLNDLPRLGDSDGALVSQAAICPATCVTKCSKAEPSR